MRTLRKPISGHDVAALQRWLAARGVAKLAADGIFGDQTATAVRAYQTAAGLEADGIVGPATWGQAFADGMDDPDALADEITVAAERAGIPARVLRAFAAVESAGVATAIRFEPHLFNRRVEHRRRVPCTPGPGGWSIEADETGREAFAAAFSRDPDAAIRSTSWGAFQVLGAHLLALYGSPAEALKAFGDDPWGVGLELVAAWFRANPRARRAAAKAPPDWHGLARAYNGPGYATHGYHRRLRQAWEATA